jgi:DNA gyrase/topoisomerase IV subunit B
MDAEELSHCLLNKDTRNIIQLTVEDITKTNNMFNDLYGKDVEPRVKFLLEHSEEARND